MALPTLPELQAHLDDGNRILVFYHANCMDGLGALYAAHDFSQSILGFPVQYGYKEIPHLKEVEPTDLVFLLDFSFPKADLATLRSLVKGAYVIDHHKTAQQDLADDQDSVFDMKKSGAVLAWEYFRPGAPVPWLLSHIQDRDLWTWALPHTRAVFAGLKAMNLDKPEALPAWAAIEEHRPLQEDLVLKGAAITEEHFRQVVEACHPEKVRPLHLVIAKDGGIEKRFHAALLNTTVHTSEVGNYLVELLSHGSEGPVGHEYDVAIMFFIGADGLPVLSFRSLAGRANEADVSEIAKLLGGGGHKNASGAKLTGGLPVLAEMYRCALLNKPYTILHPDSKVIE